MEDKKLNEKESLELITQMIQNTRRNLDTGSGNMFLVWGYVSVLVTLTVLAGVYFTKNPLWMWGFWGIPVIGYLLTFLLMRKRQKMVKSYIDKILVQVWRMFGLICMIFVLMATDLERYEVILPMGAIVMSMGSIITGCIIRYTTFFIFPAMGLMWGMKSFFDALNSGTSYVSLVWFTGVVVFAMIVPGHILNYKARKEFMVWMIVLLFILFPVAIKEVQWESVGNMVFYTLGHAFIGASFVGNISLCIVEK